MKKFVIEKKYKFHAAHRNELMVDKCFNIHGHTYFINVGVSLVQHRVEELTMSFEELDKRIEPVIMQCDHCLLLHTKDPHFEVFKQVAGRTMDFPFPTSVENVSRWLFEQIEERTGLTLAYIEVQETTTSVVRYEGPDTRGPVSRV